MEGLLSLAGRDQLTCVLRQFSLDWETACCDRFASFVTQSLVLHSNQFLGDGEWVFDEGTGTVFLVIIIHILKYDGKDGSTEVFEYVMFSNFAAFGANLQNC